MGGHSRPERIHEEAVELGNAPLAGVITRPLESGEGPPRLAVVLFNAGATHRVGPNRLYVRMARCLAERGHVVLRFDAAGIGDSPPRQDGRSYVEDVLLGAREAMDFLAEHLGVREFVLSGICSGGATAFVAARNDGRVVGALMINAQGHLHADHPEWTESIQRRALKRHFWRIALFSSFRAQNWRKLLRGHLSLRRMTTMMLGPAHAGQGGAAPQTRGGGRPDPKSDVEALVRRGVRLLHVYSEGDEGLDYFRVMLGRLGTGPSDDAAFQVRILKGVNHLFTQLWAQDALVRVMEEWIDELSSTHATP